MVLKSMLKIKKDGLHFLQQFLGILDDIKKAKLKRTSTYSFDNRRMLRLLSANNNRKVNYEIDSNYVKKNEQNEIKFFTIQLNMINKKKSWNTIGYFALIIEYCKDRSSYYLMFYNLQNKSIIEQEIFAPMYTNLAIDSNFLTMQSDKAVMLINFTSPFDAKEFYVILQEIQNKVYQCYCFPILTIKNIKQNGKNSNKKTLKSVIKDFKMLLANKFNKKMKNIKDHSSETTSKFFKGISNKFDEFADKFEMNEKLLNSTPKIQSNNKKVISRSSGNYQNSVDKFVPRQRSYSQSVIGGSQKTSRKDSLNTNNLPRKNSISLKSKLYNSNLDLNRTVSKNNLVSSKRKLGNSNISLNSTRSRDNHRKKSNDDYNLRKDRETKPLKKADRLQKYHEISNDDSDCNAEQETKTNIKTKSENPVKSNNTIYNQSCPETENNPKINDGGDHSRSNLLQDIRNMKLSNLKKTKTRIGNSFSNQLSNGNSKPANNQYSNASNQSGNKPGYIYNIDLSSRRNFVNNADEDSDDE